MPAHFNIFHPCKQASPADECLYIWENLHPPTEISVDSSEIPLTGFTYFGFSSWCRKAKMAEIADGGKLIFILFTRLFKYSVFDLVEEVWNIYSEGWQIFFFSFIFFI